MATIIVDNQALPSTPSSGASTIFVDATAKILTVRDDAGVYRAQSNNAAIAAQGAGFSSDTYLTNSEVVVPSFGLQAKTTFMWAVSLSKTAAGIAAPVITLRIGPNKTTADAARVALTLPAQTAVADVATLYVMATVRSVGGGTSAVIAATAWFAHRGTAASSTVGAGFSNDATGHTETTGSGFDSTTAPGLFVGLSLNGGQNAAWTVTQAQVEATWG